MTNTNSTGAGTVDAKLADVSFTNLTFEYATWRRPSQGDGYVEQQSGGLLGYTYMQGQGRAGSKVSCGPIVTAPIPNQQGHASRATTLPTTTATTTFCGTSPRGHCSLRLWKILPFPNANFVTWAVSVAWAAHDDDRDLRKWTLEAVALMS